MTAGLLLSCPVPPSPRLSVLPPSRLSAVPSFRPPAVPSSCRSVLPSFVSDPPRRQGRKSERLVIGGTAAPWQTDRTRHDGAANPAKERRMSPASSTTREIPAWSEDPLTARARSVWTSGDFLPIARSFAPGAEEFIARLALRPGESVLDVACGTGNLAIPAARAGACVTGIDIAPNLIAQARHEARTAGLDVEFEVGDAEALPYHD